MEPVTLHTERFVLSTPTAGDVDTITKAVQDPEILRWTTLPQPYTRADAATFVENTATWWSERSELTWAIRDHGAMVGIVGLHGIADPGTGSGTSPGSGSGEIGYWVAAPARGRGVVTEAARAVLDFAFDAGGVGLVRVVWKAVVGNLASARAARRLGFHYEGTLRQGLVDVRGRYDGWIAGLLRDDDRTPQQWPML